jgi:tRNA pseudouridine38-40 synthase
MARVVIGVEYDGAAFHGWQQQAQCATVQATLEEALGSVAASPVELHCAGRTDAGVHARAQVAHFDTAAARDARGWLLGSNAALPPTVSLRWVHFVDDQFHARYSALRRTYRYLVLNRGSRSALAAGRALCVHRPLDAAAMESAGSALVGLHDFSAFRAAECQSRTPMRRLDSLRVSRHADWLWIEVTANAFLHHMVRNIVGALLAVGRGDAPLGRVREQLESRDRASGEPTAPAHGLYLWGVEYPPAFGLPDDSAMIGILELAGE